MLWSADSAKSTIRLILFWCYYYCCLSLNLAVLPRLDNYFVSKSPREEYASYSPGLILDCSYITYLYSQINFFHNYYNYSLEFFTSHCLSKFHRSLCVSFSRRGTRLCIYNLLAWSNLNSLYISQWITLPTQSCLTLYSFCARHSVWVPHTSVCCGAFSRVWKTLSLLRSPGLFSECWSWSCCSYDGLISPADFKLY